LRVRVWGSKQEGKVKQEGQGQGREDLEERGEC